MITYNGNDLSNLITVQDVKRPLLAPQKLSTVSIEGRDGSFYYQKVSESVTIEIELSIKAESPTDLRSKVRELAELIDADEPKPLIVADEPDKYINAIIADESQLETIYRVGQGVITMFAPDPYWYAVEDDIFEYTTTGIKNFTRKGNTISYPTIEIIGTSNASGSFTVVTDNASLKYTGELKQGERLVLDSELLTAYIIQTDGSNKSAIPNLDKLDFPVLVKGANSINVIPSGATLTSYKVTCNSRWK